MYLNNAQRKEIRELSKEVFGSSGRAEKILRTGMPVQKTVTKIETVTNEDGTTSEKEVKSVVTSADGRAIFVMEYPTAEKLVEQMLDMKAQVDAFKVKIAEMQKEAQIKKEEALKAQQEEFKKNEIMNDVSGSAV